MQSWRCHAAMRLNGKIMFNVFEWFWRLLHANAVRARQVMVTNQLRLLNATKSGLVFRQGLTCFKSSRKNNSASEKHVVSPGVPVWLCLNYRHSLGICKIINNKKKKRIDLQKKENFGGQKQPPMFPNVSYVFPIGFPIVLQIVP